MTDRQDTHDLHDGDDEEDMGPVGGLILGSLIAGLMAAIYGYVGAIVPFLVLDLLLLLFGLGAAFMAFASINAPLFVRLLMSIVGCCVCLSLLWFGWFAWEFGFGEAFRVILSGPVGLWERLADLSSQYQYSVSRRTVARSFDASTIWIVETALFAVAPVLGAIIGQCALADEDDEDNDQSGGTAAA